MDGGTALQGSDAFDWAFGIVVGIEAGYVNDPDDPGGETKYGISKRSYPDEDIKNLTLARAKALYLRDFWLFCGCQALPEAIALALFDGAVNQGQGTAAKLLQRALHVKADGKVGAVTVRAVYAADQEELLCAFLGRRAKRYGLTRNFDRDGNGWMTRLFTICLAAEPKLT